MTTLSTLEKFQAYTLLNSAIYAIRDAGLGKYTYFDSKKQIEELNDKIAVEKTEADGFCLIGLFAGESLLFAQGYENGEALSDMKVQDIAIYNDLKAELA